jgi:16S rRNA (cytosine1402-N4)-methyltransferase
LIDIVDINRMDQQSYKHIPVLLEEVLQFLDPKPGENFVDGTLGGGGYSRAILEKNQPGGKVLAIDLDDEAIKNFQYPISNIQDKLFIAVQGNFANLDKIIVNHKFFNISGIVADIGLSSFQLDDSGRGISFQKKEPLDMRFDQTSQEPDAKFILNNHSLQELTEIFRKYGEDKYSAKIAKEIVQERSKKPIHYTSELFEIIEQALPKPVKHKANDSARRIFQALRIAVNHELSNLESFLPKALDLLNPGGRLVVVSFHSLEDRIVKQFFQASAKGCICPLDFPQCICGKNAVAKILTKKPVTASTDELEENSRSKPAKLRALIKL